MLQDGRGSKVMRKNSNKAAKVNEDVFRTLSLILHDEVKDPRVDPMKVSITSVEVTADLKLAKCYISVFGDEADKQNALKGLKNSQGFIRHELARRLNLRNTPELNFILDNSIEYGARMTKLIDELNISHEVDHDDNNEESV